MTERTGQQTSLTRYMEWGIGLNVTARVWVRPFVWFLAVVLLLAALYDRAAATQCLPATPQQHVESAELIVIGSVTAMDQSVMIRSGNSISMPEKGVPFTLTIERVYKGEVGPELTVHQRAILGAPNLFVGDRWLLFLHRDGFGNLTAGPCTPSLKLVGGAGPGPELATSMGPGRDPAPGQAAGPIRGWLPWAAAAAGVVAAGAVLFFIMRRRRA